VKNYSGNRVLRFACGANGGDFNWTDVLMARVGQMMNGLSVHYYSIPTGNWNKKGPSTGFGEEQWFGALEQTLKMDELLTKHAAIMDKHDPQKKIGMIVDEWGLWYDPEPGSNPGFLYQQNTIRDALAAAINLNIFHLHNDRVAMANIAQMVNVLQAMILTDKQRMVLTPTYHVFDMYQVHQGATVVPVDLEAPAYSFGGKSVPGLHATASKDASGKLHLSLVNLNPDREIQLNARLQGISVHAGAGRVLAGNSLDAHNTFDQPDVVAPADFRGAQVQNGDLRIQLPAKSVVVIELQ
jgi:alpha-N-arabinofuranosidase